MSDKETIFAVFLEKCRKVLPERAEWRASGRTLAATYNYDDSWVLWPHLEGEPVPKEGIEVWVRPPSDLRRQVDFHLQAGGPNVRMNKDGTTTDVDGYHRSIDYVTGRALEMLSNV